jgi:hypothetical protein|tara:strand:+ start:1324 stop:1599 length:276 start_codon:yes stop_codon:yes gene_type:complete
MAKKKVPQRNLGDNRRGPHKRVRITRGKDGKLHTKERVIVTAKMNPYGPKPIVAQEGIPGAFRDEGVVYRDKKSKKKPKKKSEKGEFWDGS